MRDNLRAVIREMLGAPLLSEALMHHIQTETPITEPVFRPGSDRFFSLMREAREAWHAGLLDESVVDPWVMSLDLGEWGLHEGVPVPLDFPVPEMIAEAEYKGRKVKVGQPFRVSGGGHKFAVYVRDPKTKNIKKVQFGAPGKLKDPKRRKSFAARHRCEQKNDKTTPGYWACRIGRYPKLFGGNTYYRWW
jgi:hypothetical protein